MLNRYIMIQRARCSRRKKKALIPLVRMLIEGFHVLRNEGSIALETFLDSREKLPPMLSKVCDLIFLN